MTGRRRRGIMRAINRVQAGAVGGLLAGIAVAALFFIQGAITLHPLSVPESLASGLFSGGSGDPVAMSQPWAFIVLILQILAYTALHLLAFTAVGASAALAVNGSTFRGSALGGAAYAAVACTALLYLARWFIEGPVALDVLGLPRVLVVNAAAGVIIGTSPYLGEQTFARETEPRQ